MKHPIVRSSLLHVCGDNEHLQTIMFFTGPRFRVGFDCCMSYVLHVAMGCPFTFFLSVAILAQFRCNTALKQTRGVVHVLSLRCLCFRAMNCPTCKECVYSKGWTPAQWKASDPFANECYGCKNCNASATNIGVDLNVLRMALSALLPSGPRGRARFAKFVHFWVNNLQPNSGRA